MEGEGRGEGPCKDVTCVHQHRSTCYSTSHDMTCQNMTQDIVINLTKDNGMTENKMVYNGVGSWGTLLKYPFPFYPSMLLLILPSILFISIIPFLYLFYSHYLTLDIHQVKRRS